VFKLINRSKGGIFGGKSEEIEAHHFRFVFYLFNANWLNESNAILLINYRLHYRL